MRRPTEISPRIRLDPLHLILTPQIAVQRHVHDAERIGPEVDADIVGRRVPDLACALEFGARARVVAVRAMRVGRRPARDPAKVATGLEAVGGEGQGGVAGEDGVVVFVISGGGCGESESAGAQAEEEGDEELHLAFWLIFGSPFFGQCSRNVIYLCS